MVTIQHFLDIVTDFTAHCNENYIRPEGAMLPSLTGMKMYDAPILAVGNADDPLFDALKAPGAVGPHHLSPQEWLPGAKSVISVFLPITQAIRDSNKSDPAMPSPEWLHARCDAPALLRSLSQHMTDYLLGNGYQCLSPSIHWDTVRPNGAPLRKPGLDEFTSNWSERHVAYVCGLGTFGLSRGLITRKGMAGRFTSFVTDCPLEPTPRTYDGIYSHCILCGACAASCPVQAITVTDGKAHPPCYAYMDATKALFSPRSGCGKCQVGVPCEAGIPR